MLLPLSLLLLAPTAPPPGTVVAVGYGGRRAVSADAKTWDVAAEWAVGGGDDSDNLMSVVYANGKFVASGGGTPKREKTVGGHVVVSDDGKAWREVHTAKFRVHPVLFGGGKFVAGGPNRNFLVSDDGEAWRDGAKITAKEASHFRHGAFGNGRFVFVGNAGGNSPVTWVAVTADGTKLDHVAADLPPLRGLTFAAGVFVAVGPDGVRLTSPDGVAWTEHGREPQRDLTWVVWTGREFVAGGQGKKPFRSADGATWSEWPAAVPCSVLAVTPGGWVGTTWPGQMWHSPDGVKWTKGAKATPNGMNAAAWAP